MSYEQAKSEFCKSCQVCLEEPPSKCVSGSDEGCQTQNNKWDKDYRKQKSKNIQIETIVLDSHFNEPSANQENDKFCKEGDNSQNVEI